MNFFFEFHSGAMSRIPRLRGTPVKAIESPSCRTPKVVKELSSGNEENLNGNETPKSLFMSPSKSARKLKTDQDVMLLNNREQLIKLANELAVEKGNLEKELRRKEVVMQRSELEQGRLTEKVNELQTENKELIVEVRKLAKEIEENKKEHSKEVDKLRRLIPTGDGFEGILSENDALRRTVKVLRKKLGIEVKDTQEKQAEGTKLKRTVEELVDDNTRLESSIEEIRDLYDTEKRAREAFEELCASSGNDVDILKGSLREYCLKFEVESFLRRNAPGNLDTQGMLRAVETQTKARIEAEKASAEMSSEIQQLKEALTEVEQESAAYRAEVEMFQQKMVKYNPLKLKRKLKAVQSFDEMLEFNKRQLAKKQKDTPIAE